LFAWSGIVQQMANGAFKSARRAGARKRVEPVSQDDEPIADAPDAGPGLEGVPPVAASRAADWIRPAHQERSRQQRDRILKAGERVFAQHGYFDAHVSQIVAQAGCSIGSFYRRFKDKEALFFALQDDMYENAKIHIARFFDSPLCQSLPVTHIVFRLVDNAAREMQRIKGYYRALFEISLKGQDVWLNMRDLEVRQAEGARRLLERRGHVPGPAFLAETSLAIRAVNSMNISMLLHGPGPFAFEDLEGRKALTRMLMRTMGVEPDEACLAEMTPRPTR
jgi:AcrR family transcriptional regulator